MPEDYDAVRKSIVMKRDISICDEKILHRQSVWTSKVLSVRVILVQGEISLYLFAQSLLLFHVNLHRQNSEEEKFALPQYFEVTSTDDEIYEELNCVCLRLATDNGLDYSKNFNVADSKTIEAGGW